MNSLVLRAMQHLDSFESSDYYPLYTYDRDMLHRLATAEQWTDEDKRSALFLFAKYRRVLMRDGFDYYAVFPKTRDSHDLEERTKKVYQYLDYLAKHHGVKPPRGAELMMLESLEAWVKNKIIEVRILNAERNGTSLAASR